MALWAEIQRLRTHVTELEAKQQEPVKDARNSSVSPSHTPKANTPPRPLKGTRCEASVGRAGGGRPLRPDPDQVIIAKAKGCPHGGQEVSAAGQSLQAVYELGDFELALRGLLGEGAPLSAPSLARLKAKWPLEYAAWKQRRRDDLEILYV